MSVSHTVGILVLAALVVGAQGVLAPDAIVRRGAGRGGHLDRRHRRLDAGRRAAATTGRLDGGRAVQALRTTTTTVTGTSTRPRRTSDPGEHSHGGVRHSHLPPTGSTITWRSLFVLGLAGGLIPSTSALLILLGSIAAGRPAFGFVLVVAFGVGMAAVMAGIGLAMVYRPRPASTGSAAGHRSVA